MSEVIVGDVWEGKSSPSAGWGSALLFRVESISGKTATLASIPDGDRTKTPLDFASMDIWRLVKRQGHHTFCQDCNPEATA